MAEAFVTPPAVNPLLANRRLYLCTPDRPDLEAFLSACVAGGVDLVQLRDKHLDAGLLTTRARLAVRVCRDLGVPFIMNDRPDIALEVNADGVHVGQDDVTPEVCRRILGPNAIVGLSTHAPVELDASTSKPVDYISVGPVAATPTKPGRPGTGLGYVRYAAGVTSQPFFITGGVTPDNIDTLIKAGAQRFVVVRWLAEAPNPMEAASALRRVIDERLAAV